MQEEEPRPPTEYEIDITILEEPTEPGTILEVSTTEVCVYGGCMSCILILTIAVIVFVTTQDVRIGGS